MIVRRLLFGILPLAIVLLASSGAHAVPWGKKIEADRNETYQLKEENGPWLIMAATFTGDGAHDQAAALVHEFRSKHKLPAFTYQKKFDFSKPTTGKGIDRYGGPSTMRNYHNDVVVEIAVMVGEYPSPADPDAKKMLKKIKYMHPAALSSEKQTAQSLAAVRAIQRQFLPEGSEEKNKGPMGTAFLTTNPLLPNDYFAPKGLDKFVVDMNKGVKFSLLDCPGRYTVKVATFTGQSALLTPAIQEKLDQGFKLKSSNRLEEAAEKAHKLTMALRAKGVQAFEFHDRYLSLVTVGSFDTVGTRRPDGKIELNPAVHAIMKQYGAETKITPGQAAPQVGKPKNEAGISFDVSPTPVEVPRRSIPSDYTQTAKGR